MRTRRMQTRNSILAGCTKTAGAFPQDDSLAIEWYRKAVQQGQPDALYSLGRMYEDGRAVRQNFVKAYRLYFRASLHGIREADDAMLELKKRVGFEDRKCRRPKPRASNRKRATGPGKIDGSTQRRT